MPALPAVAKVVRVDHRSHMGGDLDIMWRLFFQYTGTLNTADATTWANAIATAFKSFISGGMVTAFHSDSIELTDLSSGSAPQVIVAASQAGTDSAATPPAGLAMVVSY